MMPRPTKAVTIRQVYKALEKNGFEYVRGDWFREDIDGAIYGGCVLGQTALNLGVEAKNFDYSLEVQLNKFHIPPDSKWALMPEWLGGSPIGYNTLGSIIIFWNDQMDEKGYKYYLNTYEEVAEMAKELMEPFFKETINLQTREWNFKKLEPVHA